MSGDTKLAKFRKEYATMSTADLQSALKEQREIAADAIANEREGGDLEGLKHEAFRNKTAGEKMQLARDVAIRMAAIRAELKPRLDDAAYEKAVTDRALGGDLDPATSATDNAARSHLAEVLGDALRGGKVIKSVKDFFGKALDDGLVVLNPSDPMSMRSVQRAQIGDNPDETVSILNAVFTEDAGYDPEVFRSGRIVMTPQRRQDLLDAIRITPTSKDSVKYMEETTYTPPAGETMSRAEGGTAAEATLEFAEKTQDLVRNSVIIPLTDDVMNDEPRVRSLVSGRLMHMLRQRVGREIILGSGTGNRMAGFQSRLNANQTDGTAFPNTDSVTDETNAAFTRRIGTDGTNIPVFRPADADGTGGTPYEANAQQSIIAIIRACEWIERNGDAMCDMVALSGPSWAALLTALDDDNRFIMPQMMTAGGGMDSMMMPGLGIPMRKDRHLAAGRALVGDFGNYAELAANGGFTIELGYSGTDFVKFQRTLRANVRMALITYRLRAFGFVQSIVT